MAKFWLSITPALAEKNPGSFSATGVSFFWKRTVFNVRCYESINYEL